MVLNYYVDLNPYSKEVYLSEYHKDNWLIVMTGNTHHFSYIPYRDIITSHDWCAYLGVF